MNWQPPGFQPPGWQPPGWQPGGGEGETASAVISGTAGSDFTENAIRDGGRTILIDLAGDTWESAGFDAARQAIIDGITSAQSETLGWNNEVRDKEVVTAVVRTSATRITITLTASSLYEITASESITVTIPAAALVSSATPIVASPSLSALETQRGIASRRGRKPTTRKVSVRSAAYALAGPEQEYPVYRFSNRIFLERPKHNPFKDL